MFIVKGNADNNIFLHFSKIKKVSKGEEEPEAEQEPEPGEARQLIQRGSEVISEGGDNLDRLVLSGISHPLTG